MSVSFFNLSRFHFLILSSSDLFFVLSHFLLPFINSFLIILFCFSAFFRILLSLFFVLTFLSSFMPSFYSLFMYVHLLFPFFISLSIPFYMRVCEWLMTLLMLLIRFANINLTFYVNNLYLPIYLSNIVYVFTLHIVNAGKLRSVSPT